MDVRCVNLRFIKTEERIEMFYETEKNNHGLKYSPFKACVTPRPIAWISTLNENGTPNIGPYSYFNAVSDIPPMIMFSSSYKPDGSDKDTITNIRRNGEFVVNIANFAAKDLMNQTSAPLARGESEAEFCGLKMLPSRLISAPRIAISPINMECTFVKTVSLDFNDHKASSTVVIGHVVAIHVDNDYIKDGMLDSKALDVIARLGYNQYARVSDIFEMAKS